MAVGHSHLKWKLSTTSGSVGNSTAQPDPNACLGKYTSTTELTDNLLNNLFDNVTGPENAASDVEYRCLFLHNTSDQAIKNIQVWLSSEVASGAAAAVGVDTTAASDADATTAQGLTVADEGTAPTGVSFSTATTKLGGVAVGTLDPDQVIGVWVRRTAANTAAVSSDGVTIRAEGNYEG